MKGIFWNSRGLGDLAKHRFLSDLVKEEQISFIALSETGVRVRTSFGIVWPHMVDLVASY